MRMWTPLTKKNGILYQKGTWLGMCNVLLIEPSWTALRTVFRFRLFISNLVLDPLLEKVVFYNAVLMLSQRSTGSPTLTYKVRINTFPESHTSNKYHHQPLESFTNYSYFCVFYVMSFYIRIFANTIISAVTFCSICNINFKLCMPKCVAHHLEMHFHFTHKHSFSTNTYFILYMLLTYIWHFMCAGSVYCNHNCIKKFYQFLHRIRIGCVTMVTSLMITSLRTY